MRSNGIPILFQEVAPVMGVPIYDEQSCPVCQDLNRLSVLKTRCKQQLLDTVENWTEERILELQPIAVDSPDFRVRKSVALKKTIEVLTPYSLPALNA